MKNELIEEYSKLSITEKRNILINDMVETIETIQKICAMKNVKYDKLKSKDILINRNKIYEEEFLYLLYVYNIYLKEDLGSLLLQLLAEK